MKNRSPVWSAVSSILAALVVGCASDVPGGGGGAGAGWGGTVPRGGTEECAAASKVIPKNCMACVVDHCEEDYATCLGDDWQQYEFADAPCSTFLDCVMACCGAAKCTEACGDPPDACLLCLAPAVNCTNQYCAGKCQ